MTIPFLLPDLGEGVHEAEILAISVTVDQPITEGDPLLEVETDKAAVTIPSPVTGVVAEILVAVGDIAKVGESLIIFSGQETVQKRAPVPASPSTRRLARELGVDLHNVTATGRSGIVTVEDVKKAAAPEKVPPPQQEDTTSTPPRHTDTTLPDFSKWGEIEKIPFRSIRRKTADIMANSWSRIPHVNCQDLVDVTLLEDFRQRHKKEIEEAGGRLTMTVFAIKAVATALKTFPQFNASLDEERQEIILKHYFHIGVAVDTTHGLVVPVIRDVDRKSIRELALELHSAIEKGRNRELSRDELTGGTFTITNAGAIGGSHFTAIINHPEIAILGMGQARMEPAARTDDKGDWTIVPRLMMPVILCFDHRVADGGDAIRFMQVIVKSLQDPDELLMTMI